MLKSTIPFFLISTLLVLVLNSCGTTSIVKDFVPKALSKTSYDVSYFSDTKIDYVYKANITVYGHELSGIFIAKKISETTHRVVFTTEFGNKLLDVEISETDFKVNAIVDELNRNLLLRNLKTDFRLLFKNQYVLQEQLENDAEIVYKSAIRSQSDYLFVSKKDGKLIKIIRASKRKEKINFSFTSENNIFAQSCTIEQHTLPIKITLNYFQTQ